MSKMESVNPPHRAPIEIKKGGGEIEYIDDVERIEVSNGFVFIYVGNAGKFAKMVPAATEITVKF